MSDLAGQLFNNETYYTVTSKENREDEPVVVLVHGIGTYHIHFESLETALVNEGFTVLNFDLKGRGYSPFPSNTVDESGKSVFNGDGHVKQMRDLIVSLSLPSKKYHLVGHSMGGAIVSLYASKFGAEEVLSVTMLTQAGLMDLGPVHLLRNASCLHGIVRHSLREKGKTGDVFWDSFYLQKDKALPQSVEAVRQLVDISAKHPHIFEAVWHSILHYPLSGLKPQVKELAQLHHIRTLIVWADKDKVVPMAPNLKRWTDIYSAAKHPNVEVKIFKDAGHCFFIERNVEFNADMVRFLKGGSVVESAINSI